MNVPYNEINARDAAKMIGIDYTTLIKHCRKGAINVSDVGGGKRKPRYMFTENEVEYMRGLKGKYGKRFFGHYDKNWNVKEEPAIADEQELFVASNEDFENNKIVPVIIKEDNLSTKTEKVDIDKIAITIGYIQDIKERLNDLEAEKNQLLKELEELRKEVMDVL